MAQMTIIIGGGTPSHSINLGTDQEALAMMREALQGGPLQFVNTDPGSTPSEPATPIDWSTAAPSVVVERYAEMLAKDGRRLAQRGRRNR